MFGFIAPPVLAGGQQKHPETAKSARPYPTATPDAMSAFGRFCAVMTRGKTRQTILRGTMAVLCYPTDAMTCALKIKLSADTPLTFDPVQADTRRRFVGIAHSGKPFNQYGTQFVADLDGIRLKSKTAVLIEHDPHRAAGVGMLSVVSGGLNVDGHLLDNEHGRAIAEAADGGFPWEMSAYIESRRYEELAAGASITVNGNLINGPAVIMRDCAVREVSFVAVGADADTSAVVLSDGKPFTLQPKEQSTMTPEEQQKFDEMKAKLSQLEADKAKLEAEKHEAHIRAKLSAAGFKEDGKGGFEGVSAGSLKVLLSADPADAEALIGDWKLSAAKPPVPSALTQGLGDAPAAPEQSVKLSAATATNGEGKQYV